MDALATKIEWLPTTELPKPHKRIEVLTSQKGEEERFFRGMTITSKGDPIVFPFNFGKTLHLSEFKGWRYCVDKSDKPLHLLPNLKD